MPSNTSIEGAPTQCLACIARQDGICGALDAQQLHALARHSRQSHYGPGEELFGQDTPITGYANVVSGVIKLVKILEDGRQQVVGLKFASDFLGRPHGNLNAHAAEAACDVELCQVPRSVLDAMMEDNRSLERRVMAETLKDLDEAREWMLTLGQKSASERVASFLLLIAMHFLPDPQPVAAEVHYELHLSRSDIADFLGLTMETVSRQLTELRRAGIVVVTSKRHILIPDVAALRARAG